MSSGLVADYGSDSDSSAENQDDADGVASIIQSNSEEALKGKNLLTLSEDSSDDEENITLPRSEDNVRDKDDRLPNPLLDTPQLFTSAVSNTQESSETVTNSSVFTNRYQEAEKAKYSILEKHVKLTEVAGTGTKRQICWKFRKGKCRYGKNCKYSHELDTIPSPELSLASAEPHGNLHNVGVFPFTSQQNWSRAEFQLDNDDDSYMANAKRKRKAGINDTLCPPKKALVHLDQQRKSERPWTVKNKHTR